MTPLVLTFDVGTQSARALLVDQNGNILKKFQKKYEPPYFSKHPGWAEQKADSYWDAVCAVAQGLQREAGELWHDIAAVTCTTIRDSCLCVDKHGRPLRDVILWLDKREALHPAPLSRVNKLIFSLIQMTEAVELQRKASACNWIKENEPQLWKDTDKFIFLSAYLIFRLCGRLADSGASIVGHIPFDSRTRGWMKSGDLKRCIFDVEQEKLCELVEPGEVLGGITAEAAAATGLPPGLPLIATGSDKGCETLGLSCITPDKAAISLGTTATIQCHSAAYMEPLPFIPAYPAVLAGHYNPEVEIYRGYWLISWFKKEFAAKEVEEAARLGIAAEDLLNARLREIPAGCDGLVLQPYFTPGVIMPKAKGAVIGFSDVHTRLHLYRAIIEGINFALMDGLKTMEKRGALRVKDLYVAGGGSQSDEICQITANMFGLPVHRIQTFEACGLGSSAVAFAALGVFPNVESAVAAMVHPRDEFLPNEKEHALYKKIFEDIFMKIFDKLLPLYRKNLD